MYTVEIGGRLYAPEIVPVDYGGALVYRVSVRFADGVYCERSSLQFPGTAEEGFEQAFAALCEHCRQRFSQEGVPPADDHLKGC